MVERELGIKPLYRNNDYFAVDESELKTIQDARKYEKLLEYCYAVRGLISDGNFRGPRNDWYELVEAGDVELVQDGCDPYWSDEDFANSASEIWRGLAKQHPARWLKMAEEHGWVDEKDPVIINTSGIDGYEGHVADQDCDPKIISLADAEELGGHNYQDRNISVYRLPDGTVVWKEVSRWQGSPDYSAWIAPLPECAKCESEIFPWEAKEGDWGRGYETRCEKCAREGVE
jgi:hypothetical protein